MEVFVKVNYGKKFSIEVGLMDTVFSIKEKIAKSLGISVPKEPLFFDGKLLLDEKLNAQQCQISDKSLVELFFNIQPKPKPNPNSNQMLLHQTEQSSQVPSKPIQEFINIEDSPERIFNNQDSTLRNVDQVVHQTEGFPVSSNLSDGFLDSQDWSAMANTSNDGQTEQFQASLSQSNEFLNSQGWPVMASSNDDQVFHQTEEWGLKSVQEFLGILDLPLQTGGNICIQDLPGSSNNQVFQTEQSSVPLNSFGDIRFGEDWGLQTEDFTNIQNYWPEKTEQSQVPSNAGKEIIDIPDSPVRRNKIPRQKIRVLILPYSREDKAQVKFPVYVNESENVSELRKELVKIQGLNLPEGGYFFISKDGVVYSEQSSFIDRGIEHGDTLDVFPGQIIKDPRPW